MDSALSRLIDKDAIVNLFTRFAATLDACDWEGLRYVFTGDAIYDYGPNQRWEGIDHIVGGVTDGDSKGHHPGSHRMMTNHRVRLEGEHARAVTLYRSTHLDESDPEPGARYPKTHAHEGWLLGELRRTPEGWRFTHLKHVTLLQANIDTREGRAVLAEITDQVD